MPQDPGATTRRPRLTTAALVLLLTGVSALIAVVDLAFGLGIRLSLVLLFLPAFVSGYGTARQTLVAGAWSVAGLIVSFHFQPSPPRTVATLIGVAVVLSALSLEAGRRRLRQEERVDRLRTTAGALQRQLLRSLPARAPAREPSVLVHGLYRPMEEERLVGGDIYDVADGPGGRSRILIADVQGKGLPAIGTGFAVLGAFRESAPREESLQRVAAALEDAVVRHNEQAVRAGEPERFVTALLLETDGGRTVRAVNCGHIAPLLIPGGGPAGARGRSCPRAPSRRSGRCRRRRPCRSGCRRSPRSRAPRTASPCRPGRCCCSSPTGSPRRAPPAAPSTRWRSGSLPGPRSGCGRTNCSPGWRATWRRTPTGGSATT
nr:SpoIIE family protein phosphatase [Phaeacidiphilus oryzae]